MLQRVSTRKNQNIKKILTKQSNDKKYYNALIEVLRINFNSVKSTKQL